MTSEDDSNFSLAFEVGEFTALNPGVIVLLPASLGALLPRVCEALGDSIAARDRILLLRDWVSYDFNDEDWFLLLSYASLGVHELRHFHEYLASAWGQGMFYAWLRLAGMNTGILSRLVSTPSLIVPLTRWWKLTDAEYQSAQKALAPTTVERIPPIPLWALDLGQFLMREQSSLRLSMQAGEDFDVTVLQLLEGTAFSTQLAYLGDVYQETSRIGWYLEALKLKDLRQKYTRTLNLWYSLELQLDEPRAGELVDPLIPYALRNAVAFYSLCASGEGEKEEHGQYGLHTPKYQPASIFLTLLGELSISRNVPPRGQIMPWLDACARQLGLLTLKDSLRASVRLGYMRVDEIKRDNDGATPFRWPNKTVEAYREWIAAHEFMVKRILENPEAFFDPLAYFRHLDRWVAAPGYLCTNIGNDVGRYLPGLQRETAGEKEAGDWELFQFQNPLPGARKIPVESASNLSSQLRVAAGLWTPGTGDRMHNTLTRTALRAAGRSDWEIYFS